MTRRVAILQSNYIPWKGYFDIIHDVDIFVYYDDVQYTIRDWRNRNRIKTRDGVQWLTVPVGSDRNRRICDVLIAQGPWAKKHWKTLQAIYSNAPHFHRYEAYLKEVYLTRQWKTLSELNQHLISTISHEYLGLKTRFADARDFAVEGSKFDRILNLLIMLQADVYVSGPSAMEYMKPEQLAKAGIELIYKSYDGYPEYPQRFPPFEHAVSILDLLFNVGPDAPRYIWGWREQS